MEKKLYTTQEVARALSVSDVYIRQLIGRGQAYPVQRIGNSWVFTADEIERLRTRKRTRGVGKKKQ
jgi:excisionase family DNA binding protein